MKKLKINLLSLFFLGLSTSTFAQLEYGIKGGIGLSNTTHIHFNSKSRFGFLGGVVVKYDVSDDKKHYIQSELIYSNQGEYDRNSSKDKKYKAFLNYINIPIMYKYYFTNKEKDFFIEGGPQLGFKVSEKFDKDAPHYDNHVPKTFDLAFNVGGGYSINRQLELNFRYQLGLIDTYKYNYWNNGTNRSSLFNFSVIYFIK